MRRSTTAAVLALAACGGGSPCGPTKPRETEGAKAAVTVAGRVAPRDLVASARSLPVVGPILTDEAPDDLRQTSVRRSA